MNDQILFDHLVQNGYRDAAARLASESASVEVDASTLVDDSTSFVLQRVRTLMLVDNDMDACISFVKSKLFALQPETATSERRREEILFLLEHQRVLDEIRMGSDVEKILNLARTRLLPAAQDRESKTRRTSEIRRAVGMLAYADPVAESPDRELLTFARRVKTCDDVVFLFNAERSDLDASRSRGSFS